MADATLKFDAVLEGEIIAQLRNVQSKLESFTHKTYKVKLDLDDSQFQEKLQKAYDLQPTKKIPLLSMSKSLASMKRDLASVISPLQEIGRLVDSISKKDFNMSFNMGDMTKEATGRYIENVRDYVRGVTEAKKLVSEVSRDPTWRKAATPQDMAMLGRAVQAMSREGGELEKLDKRLNQVTTKAGAERVAKDVKAYYDTYLPIIERAQALGVSSVAGKKLGIFPTMPDNAVSEAQQFASALGLIQVNAQGVQQAMQAIGSQPVNTTQSTRAVQQQAQTMVRDVQKQFSGEEIKLGVSIDKDAQRAAEVALQEIGLTSKDVNRVLGSPTDGNKQAEMVVDKIATKYAKAGDEAERFTKTTIQGNREIADGLRENITLTQTYDNETGKTELTVKDRTVDLKRQRAEQEAALKKQQDADDAYWKRYSKRRSDWEKELSHYRSTPQDDVVKATNDVKTMMANVNKMEQSLLTKPLANGQQQSQALGYLRSMREEMERFPQANAAMTSSMQSRMDNVSKMISGYRDAEKSMNSLQSEMDKQVKTADKLLASKDKGFQGLDKRALSANDEALTDYLSKYERLQTLSAQAKTMAPTDPNYDQTLRNMKTATDELGRSYDTLARKIKSVSTEQKAFGRQASSLQSQIQKTLDKNQRLAGSSYGDALQGLMDDIQKKRDAGHIFNSGELTKYKTQIQDITTAAADAGKMGNSLGQSIVNAFKKFGGWQLVTHSMMRVINTIRQMIQNVRDLDKEMTELKKVTDLTDSGYDQFFERAKTRAKETGATLTDTIRASADFSRLGYIISDAEKLADVAIVYKNVGDGIEDIDTASQSIISTMKAFGVETKDAYSVVDKFNSVGNSFAISSKGIGDALVRSASALAAGGNTLNESIALITAGNEVVQDPEKMGTTMKTVSMFLRAAKTEASEAGIETDGMAESVSKLRNEILALTGGRVDIQLDNDTFKSTYQIMKELSNVWDDLSDISQANILEKIGGKRNANVTAAILKNFETAERVVETAKNSSGSALIENEKYLDSINGKIAQFQASWQSLSSTMISSNLFKGVVDGATGVINVIDAISSKVGAIPTLLSGITAGVAAFRLSQGQRTGILDFITDGDGSIKSARLFNTELKRVGSTMKDVYKTYRRQGEDPINAGINTVGGFFGSAIISRSSEVREYEQLLDKYKSAQNTLSTFQAHDASGYLGEAGEAARENFEQASDALENFKIKMRASNSEWAQYVANTQTGQATLSGFIAKMREEGKLGKVVGAQLKTIGLNFASMLGSAAITMGISTVMQLAITGIGKLITAQEDLRKKTNEATMAYQDTKSSISDYRTEIDQIYDSFKNGNLSVDEAVQARQRLVQIQGELQSNYGSEVAGLNQITASSQQATAAIDALAAAEAGRYLEENKVGLNRAQQEMTSTYSHRTKMSTIKHNGDTELINGYTQDALRSIADELDNADFMKFNDRAGTITLDIRGNPDEVLDTIADIRSAAAKAGIDLGKVSVDGGKPLSDWLAEQEKIEQDRINKYGADYIERTNAIIQQDSKYLGIQNQITDAQNKYNDAIIKSYDNDTSRAEAIAEQVKQIHHLQNVIDNTEFEGKDGADVKRVLQDQLDSLIESVSTEGLKADLELNINSDQATDSFKDIQSALDRFKDDNGEIKLSAILEADGTDAWEALSDAAEHYGLTVESILPILAQFGMIQSDTNALAFDAASRFAELSSSTTAITEQQSALTAALQEQAGNGTISLGTYNALIATSKDFATALEYESGAMKINGEMAQNLIEAKTKEQVAEMQLAKSQALDRYKQNEEAIESLIKKQELLQKAGLDLGDAQQANLSRWQSENESIMDAVNKYNILIAQLQRATGAYTQWQNAKQTDNSDSIYKNLVTAKKDIDEALKSGQTGKGNDDYTMAVKLLVPDGEDVKSYRDNVLNRYLKLDDNGGLKWEGLGNFLNDAVKKDLMKVESDGSYKVAANKLLKDFIDEMKITPEVAKSIFDALEMYDFDFDFSDEEFLDAQNVDLAKQRVQEYQDELSKLQSEYEEIQNNKDLTPEAKTEQLDAVLQKIDDANAKEIIAEVQVDAPKLTDAEAALAGIAQKQDELENAQTTIGVDSDEAKKAQQDLEALQSYVDNLDDKTIEITVADINSKINESLKTMGDNQVGSATFEAAKADLQSYLNMLDQLPDEVKIKYGIDAEYEDKLRQILDGKVSAKDITVKVKADTTEIEQAKETVATAINTAMTVMKGGSLGSQTFDIDGNTDAAKAKIKALENQVVKIKIDGDAGPAKEKIASIQATTPVNVMVTAETGIAQAQINSLQANPVMVNVSANTVAAQAQIAALSAQIAGTSHTVTVTYSPDTSSLPTRFSSLSRTVNYVANTRNLPTRLSPITRTVNYVSTGADSVNGTAHANGTANQSGGAMAGGNWGAKSGGMTLVGELGREIVVDPHSGQWYTVGDYGAEFVNIPKGSIVFNHKQTEALLEKGYVLGRASALVSGTAMVTGGGKPPNTSSSSSSSNKNKKKKTTTTTNTKKSGSGTKKTRTTATATATAELDVDVNVNLKDKQLEEKLKDELSKMSEEFDYIIGQYEHQIFLKEQKKVDYKEIVDTYQKMMDEVHAQAEKYRAKGLSDNSKTIADLQEQWYKYRDSQRDAIADYYEDLKKRAENRIKIYSSQFEYFSERDNLKGMQAQADLMILYNEKLKKIAHETAEYYRSIGLRDSDDEIAEMKQIWLDADNAIRKVKQDIVDYLTDLVDRASSSIDDLKSAFKTFETAAEEYAKTGGFITLDTFQELMTMGPQYMQLLKDENGLLVINRENVEKLMAARVRSLAAQAMLSYAQRIYDAAQKGAIEDLHDLIYATKEASDATFGLAYATLAAAKISKEDYQAALFNMNAMYSMYTNTVEGLSITMGDEAEKMADSMNKLIEYVMDMLEDRIHEQIDHLNDLVDDYKEVVDLKKESLKVTKEENEYQKSLKNKLKEIAKIQEKLNALALDDSREAQAERKKLLEELADAQEDIESTQADKAYDIQTDALDKQYDAYKKEKDQEIEVLEKSISSYQKKYDMAIQYIEEHWDTLYGELIAWNTEMGNSLNSEITQEWELATKALERYGSVLAAVQATAAKGAGAGIEVPTGDTVAPTTYGGVPQNGIDVIKQMMANSNKWANASESERVDLKNQNAVLGNSLKQYGIAARIDNSGTWYVGSSNKYKLYDMYNRYLSSGNMGWLKNPEQTSKQYDIVAKMKANSAKWSTYDRNTEAGKKKQDELDRANVELSNQLAAAGLPVYRKGGVWYIKATNEPLYQKYHSGGIVGTRANVKQDEVLAVLQKGEAVLDEKKQNGLYKLIDFASVLSDRLGVAFKDFDSSIFGGVTRQSLVPQTAGVAPSIINNPTITIGDTYISGANEDTLRRHQEISRNMVNEILDTLHIRK